MKLLRLVLFIICIYVSTGGILDGYNFLQTEGKDNQAAAVDKETKSKASEEKTNRNASDDILEPTEYHDEAIQVISNLNDPSILVNKQYKLPNHYAPDDLVYPNVRFIFAEKVEKRQLRKVAADALEKMFSAAEKDGIYLAGDSGYRSYETQVNLYNHYVVKDGDSKADQYSARPGHSEHQTGLSIDVSGASGQCAIQDCFADTAEATWLEDHAHDYGFIIRYPKGKENVTGYIYEPWHIRYVGKEIAKEIHAKEITLEEYFYAVKASQ